MPSVRHCTKYVRIRTVFDFIQNRNYLIFKD